MIEVELKAVVADLDAARQRVERSGARLQFVGVLADRRYDRTDRALAGRDEVLRLRVYRPVAGAINASFDWKGPTAVNDGYKQREETSSPIGDPEAFALILDRLGYVVTMAIDREIWQYDLDGAVVRFERYPRMDDLVEVEGTPAMIERAIDVLQLPRDSFTAERLLDFVARFEVRTGRQAALSAAELAGTVRYDARNA
jgi:adenylate cyclase class IV